MKIFSLSDLDFALVYQHRNPGMNNTYWNSRHLLWCFHLACHLFLGEIMPDKALIRFIAEGVLLKKLGPGVVQYSFKLLSNPVSYSHLFEVL